MGVERTLPWRYLEEQGVKRIYTLGHDPAFKDDFYRAFLKERGYEPTENGMAVVKVVEKGL